ncbi:MAG: sigma-70 family RNA polymerase sigma factor [Krumholzibacteria bacterium]|nr:sigma-70 family RNA polymerase sigma factor [Candidatus Krumholzibacteria bacterium]
MHGAPHPLVAGTGPSWPERLQELAAAWQRPQTDAEREALRSEVWVLVVGALELKIRRQAGPAAGRDHEWSYDLAVQTALGIVARFAGGDWDPRAFAPAQLQAYFALLARNRIIDHSRSAAGKRPQREIATGMEVGDRVGVPPDSGGPDRSLLAAAVAACARKLSPRARRVWFLRVFHEFPSRRVGAHPQVGMTPAAVDMAVSRANRQVRECLARQGYEAGDFGTGSFAACWEALHGEWGDDAAEGGKGPGS